jgi:thiamine biosynthesis lipoprotein
MRNLIFCLLLCTFIVTGCADSDRARQAKFYAFGTEIDISIYGVNAEVANKTVGALETSFTNVNNTWHAWQPSTLTKINDAIASESPISISEDVIAVIELAKQMAKNSDHLFNPAAGKLFELWGYHKDDWFLSRPPPADEEIQQWLQHAPTMDDITITGTTLSSTNPAIKLGFGGFAKGYAVDQAITALKRFGITNAIVNIGGDLRAIGSHGERPWVIGIRHPRQDGLLASIAIKGDESIFSSGDYERFFEYEGTRYPHILDPRTGYPAAQATSVTVIHTNAAEADAAATALFVAGDNWPQLAAKMGIEHVMLVKPNGQIELSPAMKTRVKLIDNINPSTVREIPVLTEQ